MSTKKVVIVKGSPRKNGNSAILAARVAAGAKAAGAQVESFYLHGMDIAPCAACDACRGSRDDNCAIDDDMQTLYPKLRKAYAIVIAGPVYWFSVSAQTKLFLDRTHALGGPAGSHWRGKRVGVVLTYAGHDPFDSGAVNALRMFQDGFSYLGARIVGMVCGSAGAAGAIRSHADVMKKAYQLGKDLV